MHKKKSKICMDLWFWKGLQFRYLICLLFWLVLHALSSFFILFILRLQKTVYAVTYDPRLPSITSLQAKHWRSMTSRNKYLSEVFPNPPLTAYKRQPNLRSNIIRAAVAKSNMHPTRNHRGMHKCNRQNCTSCAYILEAKGVKINVVSWKIK